MEKLNRNNVNIKILTVNHVGITIKTNKEYDDFINFLVNNGLKKDKVLSYDGNRTTYEVFEGLIDGLIFYEPIEYDLETLEENGYFIYEWEIAEEQKTYTIKDVVENEGKIYRTTSNDCIYRYDKSNLYYKAIWKLSDDWKKTGLTLGKILELEFIEYKPESKKITFEEALKEMETKACCRCLFSNRRITIKYSHFVDCSNGEYTNLSLPEIQSKWVVTD